MPSVRLESLGGRHSGGLEDLDRLLVSNFVLGTQAVFATCFFVSACTVADTANVGFNVVFTALIFTAHVALCWVVINRLKTSLWVGILIGTSISLTFLSLTTAIYWGELSGCTPEQDIDDDRVGSTYSCHAVDAYKAVCAFAVLLFVSQGGFGLILFFWQDDFSQDPVLKGYGDLRRSSADTQAAATQLDVGQPPTADL